MFYSDNPIADAERYAAYMDMQTKKLPVCCKCKNHIQDDTCFKVDDDVYCEGCMRKKYEVWTEDLMD